MRGYWPPHDVDHRDLNKAHNAWFNLREATRRQNLFNQPSNGYTQRKNGRWVAQLAYRDKGYNLGTFDTESGAREAFEKARLMFHGDFIHGRPGLWSGQKAAA